jgi:tetratricopeptide (TPR) repeat protein
LSKYQEAIKCYDEIIKLDPNDSRYWYNRACTEVLKGDIQNGLADLRKALEMNKEYAELAKHDKDF